MSATVLEKTAEDGEDMALHTVLINLNDRRRAARLLAAARAVAAGDAVTFVGLHVYSAVPPVAPVVIPYGDDVIAAVEAAENRESTAMEATFGEAVADLGARAAWICERAAGPDLAAHVMHHARGADLLVASAADADWEMAPVLDFPERLAIESGRPVLLIPNTGPLPPAPPVHAVVAWNASRESARAGFDALTLFDSLRRLTVLVIDDGDADEMMTASADRFAEAARRHGLAVDVVTRPESARGVGAAIDAEAAALGADLLVMGAYGHSRFRELVFGGATRHITHHMQRLTLLSH